MINQLSESSKNILLELHKSKHVKYQIMGRMINGIFIDSITVGLGCVTFESSYMLWHQFILNQFETQPFGQQTRCSDRNSANIVQNSY